MRFPRHGKGDFGEWLRESNKRTISFAMIETRAAVDILDRILDTPGIDAIFLGPSDFSIAWTNGARVNATLEDMMQTVEQIAGRTRKAGKYAGIYVIDPAIVGPFRVDGLPVAGHGLGAYGDEAGFRCATHGSASVVEGCRNVYPTGRHKRVRVNRLPPLGIFSCSEINALHDFLALHTLRFFPTPSDFPHTPSQQLACGNGCAQPPFRQVWRWSNARWVARDISGRLSRSCARGFQTIGSRWAGSADSRENAGGAWERVK